MREKITKGWYVEWEEEDADGFKHKGHSRVYHVHEAANAFAEHFRKTAQKPDSVVVRTKQGYSKEGLK